MKPQALVLFSPHLVTDDLHETLQQLVDPIWMPLGIDLSARNLSDVTILITGARSLPTDQLAHLPNLELVLVTGTGYEYIDHQYCESSNITVCNTPSYTGSAVAEHAFALFMHLAKRIGYLDNAVRDHLDTSQTMSMEVEGKVAGIVGFGYVGKRINNFANAFGMNVVYVARSEHAGGNARRLTLEEMLKVADVIFLALPKTNATEAMFNAQILQQMKPGSFLINVSAEALIDRDDLISALNSGTLAGAALDIINPADVYAGVANLVVTPAHGWYTPECIERRGQQWMITLESYLRGELTNVVIGKPRLQ